MGNEARAGHRGKILVVDDNASILEALALTLEDEGYEVEKSTKNGRHIEEKLAKGLPDLIILDVLLSGSDGRLICKKLKSQEATRHIPVIMISAHPNAGPSAMEAGAEAFLSKPFSIEMLIELVEKYIEGGIDKGT